MIEIVSDSELYRVKIDCIQNCKYYKSGNYRKISLITNTYTCTIIE